MAENTVRTASPSENFISEAKRLNADDGTLASLFLLDQMQNPGPPGEVRAWDRALALISNRGWPSEKIRAFFLSNEDLHLFQSLGAIEESLLRARPPWLVGPTAIVLPRSYTKNLNETILTKVLLRGMVEARSMALPKRKDPLPPSLLPLQEGINEIIAEEILPTEIISHHLRLHRQWAKVLCRGGGLDKDALERLSNEEVIYELAKSLRWKIKDLVSWVEEAKKIAPKTPPPPSVKK